MALRSAGFVILGPARPGRWGDRCSGMRELGLGFCWNQGWRWPGLAGVDGWDIGKKARDV